jgi:hypothetical protein
MILTQLSPEIKTPMRTEGWRGSEASAHGTWQAAEESVVGDHDIAYECSST